MRAVEIGYGTTALDISLGGPGASLGFALYADTAGAADLLGTELLRFQLDGLPASLDGIGAVGGTVVVNFIDPSPPLLAHGKLGWGYADVDGVTGPLTLPLPVSAYGPDSFGYEADIIPDDFDDISLTGTDIYPSVGSFSGMVVPVGFDFDFYGSMMSSIGLSTEGHLVDGNDFNLFVVSNCLPDSQYPEPTILPVGSPLSAFYTMYETKGVAPNRVFIAQWTGLEGVFCSTIFTYQVKLFESTNAIEFHYSALHPACLFGALTSFGIQQDSANALSIDCGDAGGLVEGQSYRFTLGRESELRTTNELNLYGAPATDASFIESVFVMDTVTGDDLFIASTHVAIIEDDGTCATAAHNIITSPANPTIFSSVTESTIGGTWISQVDTTTFPNATATSMSIALGVGPCGTPGVCSTIFGDLLVNPLAFILTNPGTPAGAGLFNHTANVPADSNLCGLLLYAQAAYFDPSVTPSLRLTNAIDILVGL